jgi:uncharacterized protein YndB with AHSA1/START domain
MTTREDHPTTFTPQGDQEVVISRTFAAPRELVFEASTRPEHIPRWWGPSGTNVTVCEIDLRVGGAWRFGLRTADGSEVGFRGEYREIIPPERIVHTEIYEPFPEHESLVTVLFEEQDGTTTLTTSVRYPSREVRDLVLQSGMQEGVAETYGRLAELVESLAQRP